MSRNDGAWNVPQRAIATRVSQTRREGMRAVRNRLIGQGMVLIVAIVAIPVSASASARTTGAVVNTRSGAVRGLVRGAYRVFQGIPYAAPPVGPLRWRPPEPAAHWKGVRDATRPGSPCAQVPLTVLPGGKAILPGASNLTGSISEDCLYLNVWTPRSLHPPAAGVRLVPRWERHLRRRERLRRLKAHRRGRGSRRDGELSPRPARLPRASGAFGAEPRSHLGRLWA